MPQETISLRLVGFIVTRLIDRGRNCDLFQMMVREFAMLSDDDVAGHCEVAESYAQAYEVRGIPGAYTLLEAVSNAREELDELQSGHGCPRCGH